MHSAPCPFCRAPSDPVLRQRPDYEYGIQVQLDYHRCRACGLVFADPIPVADIPSFYASYSTHGQHTQRKLPLLARASRGVMLREFESLVPSHKDEPVLDFGCGDGSFLAELRERGYTRLAGYDFDPQARKAARLVGAQVAESEEDLPALGPFAVITLNHVIEHMVDPPRDLARLGSMLRPGGRLVIRTPNARSVLSRSLGPAWRGWETPRHLHVFTPASVQAMARLPALSDLAMKRVFTSESMYLGIFHESLRNGFWRHPAGKLARHAAALVSWAGLTAVNAFAPVGEELVVAFERRAA
ncbi:class I SAM-dependent methyltransferase [Ramlibacter sp. Leaf400]|uniref:class I SAM-dependent methyltransferase n=1 Tax=Ramlibacter sp. Leaf400 TaxID=1736365 RepID=UPI0006F6438A|nr:class I SAM-dependent methyltransferase [Ramlibacter sp. Leaf400]KQT14358.1 hypothetical protein ASG30_01925 [Ramlibacter sp. Leaf400]